MGAGVGQDRADHLTGLVARRAARARRRWPKRLRWTRTEEGPVTFLFIHSIPALHSITSHGGMVNAV